VLQHQIQSLLYRQQITLGQVNVFLDNGMETFRTRCHTHTQVYVLIYKTSDECIHVSKIYDTNPPCNFWYLFLKSIQLFKKISLLGDWTTVSQWLMKVAHVIPSSSLQMTTTGQDVLLDGPQTENIRRFGKNNFKLIH
jgi:hypothetical protein